MHIVIKLSFLFRRKQSHLIKLKENKLCPDFLCEFDIQTSCTRCARMNQFRLECIKMKNNEDCFY